MSSFTPALQGRSTTRSSSWFSAGSVAPRRALRRQVLYVRASNESETTNTQRSTRRDLILTAGALASAPLLLPNVATADELVKRQITVDNLSSFQRSAEKNAFQARVSTSLKTSLTAKDAPDALRLLLHDAATYDIATGTGGVNGSIVFDEELNRPENASLKPYVAKLKDVKKAIDADGEKIGNGPIGWADLIVLAAKVTAELDWLKEKLAKSGPDGELIAKAFGASFPVLLGRKDATGPDPAGRLPPVGADVETVRAFMLGLGAKSSGGGPFAPKPPFWERPTFVLWTAAQPDPAAAEAAFAANPAFTSYKAKYDGSRKTTTRTDYEVDFIDFFTRLSKLGAKFEPDAYLFPISVELPKL